jgi:hypothetical protein
MQFLLQELRPHLSQAAALDLIARFGTPAQRVLRRPDWAGDVARGGFVALLAPPLLAGRDVWLVTDDAGEAASWRLPRGWACATQQLDALPGSLRLSLGSDAIYGVDALIEWGGLQQRLRWVRRGKFAMGSPNGPPDEGELRTVSLSEGFWIADTACTRDFWHEVMGLPAPDGDRLLPMTGISAATVDEFLARLRQALPGCDIALPSEAEWEAACRAGTRTAYACGDVAGPLDVHAESAAPAPVKGMAPNAWGLFQMHGNVAELCRDLLAPEQRRPDAWVDPEGPPGAQTGVHALRGGSFRGSLAQARSAAVERIGREEVRDDVGFRFMLRARRAEPPSAA